MPFFHIRRAAGAAPHMEASRNSVEHLMLDIFGCVVIWDDCAVGRMSRSEGVFSFCHNAQQLVAGMPMGVDEFLQAPVCILGLPLPLGVCVPTLMTLRYFTEAAQA